MSNKDMSASQLLKQANQLKRAGKLHEAIALYYQVIEINPNFSWGYYNLGDAFVKQGKLSQAVVKYREAIKINPNSALFCYSLGELLFQQGELTEAVKFWLKLYKQRINFPASIAKTIENYRTNYIQQRICFIHIPKTGGKSIHRSLYGTNVHWDSLAYHNSIRDHKFSNNPHKFSIIRNPFSFYVSLYHFFREYGNQITNPLKAISTLSFLDFICTITDCEKFKKWAQENEVSLVHFDLAYVESRNKQISIFTFYYLYMCFNELNISRLDVESILEKHDEYLALDRVIKLEKLPEEFESLMKEWNIPTLKTEKLNSSHHKHWQEYYNQKTKQLVLDKDWLIFKLYYPYFLA